MSHKDAGRLSLDDNYFYNNYFHGIIFYVIPITFIMGLTYFKPVVSSDVNPNTETEQRGDE